MRKRRSLHEWLSDHRALIGLQQTHPNLALSEMAGMCGYDFLILDGEHGVFSEADYLQALQVLAGFDIASVVRLPGHNTQTVGRYMDMGIDAIMVPNVTTAQQAAAFVRAMEYPPVGTRGSGAALHRGTRYGMDLGSHLKAPREGVCLLVMIESALGVANVEDILAVEGVDGVIIGPSDLSADLGRIKDYSQPAYAQALARIERAATERGKIVGTAPHAGSPLEALVARGHRLLIIDADMPLICGAMSAQAAAAKSCLRGKSGSAADSAVEKRTSTSPIPSS
jgi:4-hydroxy-2-oxoheptanedioate aldolase